MGNNLDKDGESPNDIDYGALSDEQRATVSPEMLRAGLLAYLQHDSRFDPDEVAVAKIYCAMVSASRGDVILDVPADSGHGEG